MGFYTQTEKLLVYGWTEPENLYPQLFGTEPDMIRDGSTIPIANIFQDVIIQKSVMMLPLGTVDDGEHAQKEKINSEQIDSFGFPFSSWGGVGLPVSSPEDDEPEESVRGASRSDSVGKRARAAGRRESRQGPSLFLLLLLPPPPPLPARRSLPTPPRLARPARRPRGVAAALPPPSPARSASRAPGDPAGLRFPAGPGSRRGSGAPGAPRTPARSRGASDRLASPTGTRAPRRGAARCRFLVRAVVSVAARPLPVFPSAPMRCCHPRLLRLRMLVPESTTPGSGRSWPLRVPLLSATSGRPQAAARRCWQQRDRPWRYPPLPSRRARPECACPLSGA
nr:translation initiation factor IF-2-like [Equus asinus]